MSIGAFLVALAFGPFLPCPFTFGFAIRMNGGSACEPVTDAARALVACRERFLLDYGFGGARDDARDGDWRNIDNYCHSTDSRTWR